MAKSETKTDRSGRKKGILHELSTNRTLYLM